MTSQTTQSITVSAQSYYQPTYSDPTQHKYVYAYRIRIQNEGEETVQLISRAWEVTAGTGERRLIEGEGVVGQQPVIRPGDYHEYTSWVQFDTPIGQMQGSYVMRRAGSYGEAGLFQVEVPRFLHLAPSVLN